MTDIVKFKDFSLSPEPISFKIDPDVFHCVPEIPLDALADMAGLATRAESATAGDTLRKVYDLFDGILFTESAVLFRARGEKGSDNPIGMRHVKDILPWLMEVYGLRPTQPSDESSDGSTDGDGSSTDTA